MLSILSIAGLAVLMTVTGVVSIWLYDSWRREMDERNKPPADFQIQILDRDNIPIRNDKLTAKSAAELIRHINQGWYK